MAGARIGFLGAGRTQRQRMEAMLATGEVEVAALCEAQLEGVRDSLRIAPDAVIVPDLKEMLELGLDGVAIGGPAAGHAAPAIAALEAGVAVFSQAPLGATAGEVKAVVDAARAADRLLGLDLPYRFTEGMQRIREYIAGGELGRVFAADLSFHAAEGPDKAWRYALGDASGAAMADLGSHLVDLALWTLGFPAVERVEPHLIAEGEALAPGEPADDFAAATLVLEGGALVRIACSWRRAIGRDAEIEATFHAVRGGAALRNVGASAAEFRAELYRGAGIETLSASADPWAGRAAARWATALADGEGFDPEAERLVSVAEVVDRIYGR